MAADENYDELPGVNPTVGLSTPDLSVAQLVAGIPIIAELLHAFGIFDLSQAQQDSLGKAVTFAFVLIGGDAAIRVGRALGKMTRS